MHGRRPTAATCSHPPAGASGVTTAEILEHGTRAAAGDMRCVADASVVVAYMLTRDERLGRRIAGLVDVEVTG